MKLILNQNLVTEVTKVPLKVQKNAVCYNGRDKEGENIELYDVEAWKVAPIVRYLITWKKKRLNIWLILLAIFFSLLLIWWITLFFLGGDKTTPTPAQRPIEIKEQVKGVTLENSATIKIKELEEKIIMTNDQLVMAEEEIVRLTKMEVIPEIITEEKIIEVEKEVLRDLNEDEKFIMYLGNIIYNKCQSPEFEEKCSKIYFNFLKYAK